MMERLLTAGADPNATAYEGQTMLMTAALSGRPEAVRLLLSAAPRWTRRNRITGRPR